MGMGGPRHALDFENFRKKGCSFSFEREKTNFTISPPPEKF